MSRASIKVVSLVGALLVAACTAASADAETMHAPSAPPAHWTVRNLFASPTPFAVGHRGYGINPGTDPTRPIENTLDAFHKAFTDGIRIVEVDVQFTADKKVVVLHDDAVDGNVCVNSLTYDELLLRKPYMPLFRAVLNAERHFSAREDLDGLIMVGIKVPIPLCDDANTSEQAALSEGELVAAVIAEIRQARMEDQVILNSGSPSILRQALIQAPEIKRALTLNALQLLTPAQVGAMLGVPVVKIPKNDCGLDWYNIDLIARLPAMPGADVEQRFASFLGVALGCAGSRAVSLDMLALGSDAGQAHASIAAVHGAGLKAIVWTINTGSEWDFVAGAGSDGITTNDIALGLANEAPLAAFLRAGLMADRSPAIASAEPPDRRLMTEEAGLALFLPRLRASAGAVAVEFSLPDAAPARIGLLDVTGRALDSRDVGSFGMGRHAVTLGHDLASGVYFVRLVSPRGQVQTKALVLR